MARICVFLAGFHHARGIEAGEMASLRNEVTGP